jgi:hypothetical protein
MDRPVQQDDALLGPVSLRRALEDVDQLHQRHVQAEDRVPAAVGLVVEEVVADEPLLVVDVFRLPVAEDHVVDALEGRAGDARVLTDDLQVFLERSLPVQLLEAGLVLEGGDA